MASHPKTGWRSSWTINLETATATHCDGWVFRFSPIEGDPGPFNGECIGPPHPLTGGHLSQAARVAREAGDIYLEVRNARH